ncbi:putative phosphatidylinositol 4-kinase [Leishmania infantum JPCM5]|uniref:1-phosphatidylinositol 4-kinase n=2 Tax=Leishmania infantum TaxID=5671 RepID=A4IAC5_LEIIN|nr:putative phosphatidylinositol 4-kinase [Leishmania infantum JPCM5]CAC9540864.1 phosphatidylinositol_4-kinase_-_putative [Leishmania infantum]CAM71782.1 putative phosphatidylinositol 4-kinase [Leishmania infantum JPCM5]SUZ45737.1 phosphatidylinositol_4-kinase_-_putative [Leishmania infantum]|eukprot:XP_001468694.1 putative phosphatidylinositol 4-kinase [Leishmania infantum JPCM5]
MGGIPKRRAEAQRRSMLKNLQLISFTDQSAEEQEMCVRQLYDTDISTLEECLLQVTHVCITHPNPNAQELLHNFMLWLAGRSLNIALRLAWTVDAVSAFYSSTGFAGRLKHIHDKLESYAINQGQPAVPSDSTSGGDGSRTSSDPEEGLGDVDASVVQRKEVRLKLYNDERTFVTTLTNLSNTLRFFPDRNYRKDELRRGLRVLNQRLESMRLVHPLCTSSESVQWIVNISVEDCTVFSSRERAPCLIRYEVIVDDTATMQDPTVTRLRQPDGRFRVRADSDEIFVPAPPPGSEPRAAPLVEASGSGAVEDASPEALQCLHAVFGESKKARMARVRKSSPWGAHPNWSMNAMIVKAGDDLRQEELALQLIHTFQCIWQEAGLTVRVKPYAALPTHRDCGLLEVIEDSASMDSIKKATRVSSIYNYYLKAYDGEDSVLYRKAQQNFVESMAGYSIISYILQIKDRHNGNLMIRRDGSLVHIDFGFLFVTSPGGLNFESAPFKLSQELIDVMGGASSDAFNYFRILVYEALAAARERCEDILALVSILTPNNAMPCFGADPGAAVRQLRGRFRDDLLSEADYAVYAKELIVNSADNWRTRRYDQFQSLQNGIL